MSLPQEGSFGRGWHARKASPADRPGGHVVGEMSGSVGVPAFMEADEEGRSENIPCAGGVGLDLGWGRKSFWRLAAREDGAALRTLGDYQS